MKLLTKLSLALFLTTCFQLSAHPECKCKDCPCTKESHCGCKSEEGCHCVAGLPCPGPKLKK